MNEFDCVEVEIATGLNWESLVGCDLVTFNVFRFYMTAFLVLKSPKLTSTGPKLPIEPVKSECCLPMGIASVYTPVYVGAFDVCL